MKLGFVSAILPDLSLEEVFDVAREEDYDCIEVMCWPKGKAERRYAGVTHLELQDFSDEDAERVLHLVAASGITISALGYYPNPLCPDEEESRVYVDHIRRMITVAARLSINRVNTFVGRDWTKNVEENWSRFLRVWEPLVSFAQKHGVRIGIENCPMYFTRDEWPAGKNLAYSPAIWRRMFADISSTAFGLNYDPSHMIWQHMDYLRPLRTFADRLVHIHAKDVRLDQDRLDEVGIMATPNEYHTPKLPGLGDVNWGRFFSVLTDVGYDGPVCVEIEDRAYEGSLEARRLSLRQSVRYLRQFIPKS